MAGEIELLDRLTQIYIDALESSAEAESLADPYAETVMSTLRAHVRVSRALADDELQMIEGILISTGIICNDPQALKPGPINDLKSILRQQWDEGVGPIRERLIQPQLRLPDFEFGGGQSG